MNSYAIGQETSYSENEKVNLIAKLTLQLKEVKRDRDLYYFEKNLYKQKLINAQKQLDMNNYNLIDNQFWKKVLYWGIGFITASALFWGSFGIYKIIGSTYPER